MTTTTQETYRVGTMSSNGMRPLYIAETQQTIGWVESDAGPAVIGDMTRSQACAKFPDATTYDRADWAWPDRK